jgi:hypothetical protein
MRPITCDSWIGSVDSSSDPRRRIQSDMMYERKFVFMYVCRYVCMYVCVYVCMYVCIPTYSLLLVHVSISTCYHQPRLIA